MSGGGKVQDQRLAHWFMAATFLLFFLHVGRDRFCGFFRKEQIPFMGYHQHDPLAEAHSYH